MSYKRVQPKAPDSAVSIAAQEQDVVWSENTGVTKTVTKVSMVENISNVIPHLLPEKGPTSSLSLVCACHLFVPHSIT